jgi:hypothetical protein
MIKSMIRFVCIGVCVASLASAASAGSVTLYNNVDFMGHMNSVDGYDPIASYFPADQFYSGSEASTLNSLELNLTYQVSLNPTGSVSVELLSDNSNTPGSLLAVLGTVTDSQLSGAPPGTPELITVTPLAPYGVAANMNYWIELVDNNPNNPTSLLWTFSMDLFGTSGNYYANASGVFPNEEGPYQMVLTGQVIPEPSSAILLGLGLVGGVFAFGRSRTCRRAAA